MITEDIHHNFQEHSNNQLLPADNSPQTACKHACQAMTHAKTATLRFEKHTHALYSHAKYLSESWQQKHQWTRWHAQPHAAWTATTDEKVWTAWGPYTPKF
jgi:hypothetical protein